MKKILSIVLFLVLTASSSLSFAQDKTFSIADPKSELPDVQKSVIEQITKTVTTTTSLQSKFDELSQNVDNIVIYQSQIKGWLDKNIILREEIEEIKKLGLDPNS